MSRAAVVRYLVLSEGERRRWLRRVYDRERAALFAELDDGDVLGAARRVQAFCNLWAISGRPILNG
jgi:hypothetical protein